MLAGLHATEPPLRVDSMLFQATLRLCHKTSLAPPLAKGLVLPAFRVITHRSQLKKTGHLYQTRCVLQPRIAADTVSWNNDCFLAGQQYLAGYQ
jgi:hypothetical protein